MAFDAAMRIFETSKSFPVEERYSLTDQIRRSSRSVCANLAEAWRKRRYEGAFINKLADSEAEAAETQIWLAFAVKCNYLQSNLGRELYQVYDQILGKLVTIINNPTPWLLPNKNMKNRKAMSRRDSLSNRHFSVMRFCDLSSPLLPAPFAPNLNHYLLKTNKL